MDRAYLVVTPFVFNDASTGYRGMNRGDPWFPYFKEHNAFDPRLEGKDRGSDDEGRFVNRDDAVAFKIGAQEIGVACEVIYFRRPETIKSNDVSGYQFLGFDVCQRGSGFNSGIVNLCMPVWENSERSSETAEWAIIRCIALYFNQILNNNRLFKNRADAEFYLQVYVELDEKYWNSCDKELDMTVFEVYVVP